MMIKSRSVAASRRCVKVEASAIGLKAQIASAVTIAAAALIAAAPADAGVILEQPKLKKAFQSDETVVSKPFELPKFGLSSGKKAPETKVSKKVEAESTSSGGIDVRSIALPGALILVGGLGAAATALDPNFLSFMDKATIRDSSIQGVGYEASIKSTYTGVIYEAEPGAPKRAAPKPAPKKGKK